MQLAHANIVPPIVLVIGTQSNGKGVGPHRLIKMRSLAARLAACSLATRTVAAASLYTRKTTDQRLRAAGQQRADTSNLIHASSRSRYIPENIILAGHATLSIQVLPPARSNLLLRCCASPTAERQASVRVAESDSGIAIQGMPLI